MTRSVRATKLLGRYQIDAELDRGAVSSVLRAFDEARSVRVAIKIDLRGDDEGRARIAHEAQLTAKVDGALRGEPPRVARVLDRHDDPPCFAMEYLEGTTLERRLDERGPVSLAEARTIAVAVGSALRATHELGYVHGDVKPGNVLLVGDGGDDVRLLDFGLAVRSGSTASGGTSAFLAPEQVRGDALAAVTDVYGLCATLFRAVTGRRVFAQEAIGDLFEAILREPAPTADVDATLDALLVRGLSKRAGERPTLAAVIAAFELLR